MARVLVLLFVAALGWAESASAQAATQQAAAARPRLDIWISSSAYGSYGDPQFNTPSVDDVSNVTETGADAALVASRQGPRTGFTLTASSLMRNFSERGRRDYSSHLAALDLTHAATARTTLSGNVRATYSAFSDLSANGTGQTAALPGEQLRTADFGLAGSPMLNYGGMMQAVHQLTTRSSLAFTAEGRRSSLVRNDLNDLREYRAMVALLNRPRRRATFTFQYGFRQAEYINAPSARPVVRQHIGTIGFTREWVHSATRRSVLRTAFGPSLVLIQGHYDYLATGQVGFDTQFSQRWSAGFGASRDMTVITGLGRRVIADSVFAQTNGQLTRALDLTIHVRRSNGSAPFDAAPGAYRSYGGSVRLNWAFARLFSTFAEYIDTYYRLAGSLRAASVMGMRDRRSVRVGVTWLFPLKGSSPTNATR